MNHQKSIYLDHAAATPLDPRVLLAMEPFLGEQFYNPSSLYRAAKSVRLAVEAARASVADQLGAKKSEIIFTAGGSESVNLALFGVLESEFDFKPRLVTTAIEHEAVLASLPALNRRGIQTTVVPVQVDGIINADKLAAAIDDETVLVSVMYANNEIGTIQPIAEIAKGLRQIRADRASRGLDRPLYLHTDAAQAAGTLDLHVSRLGVDLMSLNGSKLYGPKQTGVLYVRTGTELVPLIYGGGQERGLRSGTENVAGLVGFAAALELANAEREAESKRLRGLRDQLLVELQKGIADLKLNGHPRKRLTSNLNIMIPGIDGETAVLYLDQAGFQVSTGSACTTGNTDPSHVLLAIGLIPDQANSTLRFSLGRSTRAEDVQNLATELIRLIPRLRELARESQR